MIPQGYLDWPFRPEQRSDEQKRHWWRECYVESAAGRQLRGLYHWFLLAGPPGGGKSVALQAWAAAEADDALVLRYPPERWPGARAAWHPADPSHLSQMLAVAAQAIAETLQLQPERAAGIEGFQREFLRALLERQGGPRRYQRFVLSLPPELRDGFLTVAGDIDFFGDTNELPGAQALIQELTLLAAALDHRRVVFVVDPDQPLDSRQVEQLGDLLGWLDLTDNPDFAVVAAVRDDLLRNSPTLARARSRVSLIYTDWTMTECHEVARRHLCQALPDAPNDFSLADVMTPECEELADRLIAEECGGPNPAAWVMLTEAVLYALYRADQRLPTPIPAARFPDLRKLYFTRHVSLRLDPEAHGVWRGSRLVPVDDQPLRFLQLLNQRGRAVNWDDQELRELAGTKTNVHSIASRARRAIEPDPDDPVFLRNRRGDDGGYWLERCD